MEIGFLLSELLVLILGLSMFSAVILLAAKLLRYRGVGFSRVLTGSALILAIAFADWWFVRQTGMLPAVPARLGFAVVFSVACAWLFGSHTLTMRGEPIGSAGGMKLGVAASALLVITLPAVALLF